MATKYYCDICGVEIIEDSSKEISQQLNSLRGFANVRDICPTCERRFEGYDLRAECKKMLIDLCVPKTHEQKQGEFIKYMVKLPTLKNVELVLNMVKTLKLESFISKNMGE